MPNRLARAIADLAKAERRQVRDAEEREAAEQEAAVRDRLGRFVEPQDPPHEEPRASDG